VRQLLADSDGDVRCANSELHRMGEAIGARLADDFLAKSGSGSVKCESFDDSVVSIAEALKAYLGVSAEAVALSSLGEYEVRLSESNPMAEWVEVPESLGGLEYTAMLPAAIKGGLEAVGWNVRVEGRKAAGHSREAVRVEHMASE